MSVFSDAEISEFEQALQASDKAMKQGKRPSVSHILLRLQYTATLPNEQGKLWFENQLTRLLLAMSVKRLMDENTPDMFSVAEKAFMFSVLNTAALCTALEAAGVEFGSVMRPGSPSPENNEGEEWKDGAEDES